MSGARIDSGARPGEATTTAHARYRYSSDRDPCLSIDGRQSCRVGPFGPRKGTTRAGGQHGHYGRKRNATRRRIL